MEKICQIHIIHVGGKSGIDRVTDEMLKYKGEAVTDWMHTCNILGWKEGKVALRLDIEMTKTTMFCPSLQRKKNQV